MTQTLCHQFQRRPIAPSGEASYATNCKSVANARLSNSMNSLAGGWFLSTSMRRRKGFS
jgi:hypothetical protein